MIWCTLTHLNALMKYLCLKPISAEKVCKDDLYAAEVHWRFALNFLEFQAFHRK